LHRDGRVHVKTIQAVCKSFLDPLEMLFRMRGLNDSLRGLFRRNFDERVPKLLIALESVDYNPIALRHFRMTGTCIVLFVDRMVDDRCSHGSINPL
jgi:hypothetical protein